MKPVFLLLFLALPMAPALTQSALTAEPRVTPSPIAPPSDSLSDKLARHQGTVAPPNVDPGISVDPRPQTGTMPVIPPPGSPPGSPSGDRSVVPK